MKRSVYTVMVGVLLICLFTGGAAAENPAPRIVGLCLPEAGTDKGWNEQAKVGLDKVAAKYGFKVVLAEALGYGDIKPTLRDLVKKGCELIIPHASGWQTVAPETARETGVKFTTVENHKDVTPGLISDVDTEAGPGAYLAGILAGRMTRTNIVGVVVSGEPPTWNRMSAAFAQGLKSVKPDAKLIYSVIGLAAYADAAGGKRNTEDQIAVGADVIFGQGDGSSFGMLQACSTKKARDGGKVWFIDVIGDKREIDRADVLLSSVLFDFSVVYDEIIQSIRDGSFGKQHWVSVKNNAVHLLEPNKAVPARVKEEIEAARRKILSGEIQVKDIAVASELHDFLTKLFPR
ncbi:MAG: BMP family ABC transporter substrate-binding protein [Desulfobacterales bacterium]|nr:BMP family ABC transporter substrate-binding protein [Desulfobacterales bacterium]